jgi:hypothetical protein
VGSRVLARICRCAACVLSHTNHKAETFHAGDGVIIIGTVGEGDGDGAGGKQQRRLPLLGGADQEAASVTVPVVGVTHASGIALLGVAAARGECGGGSSGCTLCYDLNPHLLEVLNPYLSVASYTGGQETAETAVENVLVPKLRPYHCSGPGVGHTLSMTLGCENAVVTHFVVHAPVRPRVDRV